jgi:hypothetical protein
MRITLHCYTPPKPVTPFSIDIPDSRASPTILPVAYAMMESRMVVEAKHQPEGETGWTLSRSWIRCWPCCASGAT